MSYRRTSPFVDRRGSLRPATMVAPQHLRDGQQLAVVRIDKLVIARHMVDSVALDN